MADKCGKCGKTVYKQEEVKAVEKVWHKGCFKCAADGCGLSLTLKTFKGHEGQIYCNNHLPKPKATAVAGDKSTEHQRNAPKKVTEGLSKAHKGAAEHAPKPVVDSDAPAPAAADEYQPEPEPAQED